MANPTTAAELATRITLSDEAKPLLDAKATPRQLIETLGNAQLFGDAMHAIAALMDKRLAVFWSTLAVRQTIDQRPAPQQEALKAAEAWVKTPDEAARRAAEAAAAAAGYDNAAAWAAVAAVWSGGSLAPPDLPVVPPADHLCGHAASSAVLLAAVGGDPKQAAELCRSFIGVGLEILDGKRAPA